MPVEPPPTHWQLPPAETGDEHGIVGVGADLEPGTVLAAYRAGLFPMPLDGTEGGPLAWWSPDPRAVIPLDGLRVSRSLRRSCRDHEIRIDTAFAEVMTACADHRRPNGWITPEFITAYTRLHELGWAHSVEAWTRDGDEELAGGLYGVCIGGLFAGESMFHRRRDASKVALVGLVDILSADGLPRLLDVQWETDHLTSLGAVSIPRRDYLGRLHQALELPPPPVWS